MIKHYCDKCGKEVNVLEENYCAKLSITDFVNKMEVEFCLCTECKNKIVKYINSHSNNFKNDLPYVGRW